jgi:hypothetical protein
VRFSRIRLRQPSVELGIIALYGPEAAGTRRHRASGDALATVHRDAHQGMYCRMAALSALTRARASLPLFSLSSASFLVLDETFPQSVFGIEGDFDAAGLRGNASCVVC